jgi:hypothetical protein
MLLTFIEFATIIPSVPRVPDEEDQGAAKLLLRTYSAGPVSPICNDLKGREPSNADKPQLRLCAYYECGRMQPLLCSRHHRQEKQAVKT